MIQEGKKGGGGRNGGEADVMTLCHPVWEPVARCGVTLHHPVFPPVAKRSVTLCYFYTVTVVAQCGGQCREAAERVRGNIDAQV